MSNNEKQDLAKASIHVGTAGDLPVEVKQTAYRWINEALRTGTHWTVGALAHELSHEFKTEITVDDLIRGMSAKEVDLLQKAGRLPKVTLRPLTCRELLSLNLDTAPID